ncbi:hypothetical protein [Thermanaeromonas toyohensis]|nr:hypothetical protein [Thermanaeromonas toyohensis]
MRPIEDKSFLEEIGTVMYRFGRKLAGRELDGREWNEYPAESTF